jgi:two-component system, chemotaxis family, sensor kinase CheA
MSTDKLSSLVQQAATTVMMANPSDLSEIDGLHKLLDEIQQCLLGLSQLPDPVRQEAAGAATSACDLIDQLKAHESGDARQTLQQVSDTIAAIQQLNEQITRSVSPDKITVAFPGSRSIPPAVEAAAATAGSPAESSAQAIAPADPQPAAAPEESKPQTDGNLWVVNLDDADLVKDFVAEAAEHIESVEAGLLELEGNPTDGESINRIFRGFHTVKGMSGFLNLIPIGKLAHAAENLLDMARKGNLMLTGMNLDLVFGSIDLLKGLVDGLKKSMGTGEPIPLSSEMPKLLDLLKVAVEGRQGTGSAPASAPTPTPDPATLARNATTPAVEAVEKSEPAGVEIKSADSVESASKPDPEDKASPVSKSPAKAETEKVAESDESAERSGDNRKVKAAATDEKIKVSTSRLDNLVNMVGELVISQSMVLQDAHAALAPDHSLCRKVSHQGKLVRELQELSMMMRMVPIQGVFQKMARLVRDLSQKTGKKVKFTTEGEETELDRIVVDQIGDPLVHMIRNAIDHGLESAEDRLAAGKDPIGHILLRAFHQAGSIVIEIQDDGRGLNKDKILKKALDMKMISPDQELSDAEIYKLIFAAGLSTAAKVTEVSGRGVGMDVVKKNIEALRGKVEISTELGKGSIFTIRLPLTMAIIEGQIVRIGQTRYIIPIVNIESCLRPSTDQISTVQKRAEMVLVQGDLIPMVRLYKLFGAKPDSEVPSEASLVVVEEDLKRGCLMVDELLGQQQVVIKSLGDGIGKVRGISGGAIMGDGKISLIVDVPGLLEMACNI